MPFRYGTADPWKLVEMLDIDVTWTDGLGKDTLGRTWFDPCDEDKAHILMSNEIRESPLRIRVLAHELGHAVMHVGDSVYYRLADRGWDKSEQEAESFCLTLLTELYDEETGHLPETADDIKIMYGF